MDKTLLEEVIGDGWEPHLLPQRGLHRLPGSQEYSQAKGGAGRRGVKSMGNLGANPGLGEGRGLSRRAGLKAGRAAYARGPGSRGRWPSAE